MISIRDNRLSPNVFDTLRKLKALGYDKAKEIYSINKDFLSENDLSIDDLRAALNSCLSHVYHEDGMERSQSITILSLIYQGIDKQNIHFSLSVDLVD